MAENKNHLGLDKFQVTVIKSNFNSTKPIRKLIEKNQTKIDTADAKYKEACKAAFSKYNETVKGLHDEIQAYNDQIALLDKFALETTQNSCGVALTTEQVMKYLDDVQAFNEFMQMTKGQDMSENQGEANAVAAEYQNPEVRDLDAEEDQEWEDRINSGEIKEVI